ncbi:MAG: type III pantothenate kinase [Candidatus Omnitrophica bacterium]|nr:type III pantothenate kinase [Candidatus Omnitrophota bacterium]
MKTLNCASNKRVIPQALKKTCSRVKVQDAVIVSVVPAVTKTIEKSLRKIIGKRPYIIGKNIKIPIRNLYRSPASLGQDRLVNAFAASQIYGSPAIIIDLGTAITLDVVSGDKKYLGGMILPGPELSLKALNRDTALLPKLKLEAPAELIGRNTKNSILSGVVIGSACLCDELVRRLKARIGKNALVIATGGNAKIISKYSKEIAIIDPTLTLRGLNIIYKKTLRKTLS